MPVRDEVLCGDAAIGNYVVGFFDCSAGDGESAEDAILAAYRALGFRDVRPDFRRGCMEGVVHDGLHPTFEKYVDQHVVRAEEYARACARRAGLSPAEVEESVRRYRTEV